MIDLQGSGVAAAVVAGNLKREDREHYYRTAGKFYSHQDLENGMVGRRLNRDERQSIRFPSFGYGGYHGASLSANFIGYVPTYDAAAIEAC